MGPWHVLAGLVIGGVVAATLYFLFADDWLAADVRRAVRRPLTYVVGLPSFLLVLLVGVPFLYLQSTSVESAPPLTFEDLPGFSTSTTIAPSTTVSADAAVPVGELVLPAEGTAPPSTAAPATTTTVAVAPPLDGAWVVGEGSQARYAIDDTILGQTQRVVGTTREVSGSMQVAGSTVQAVRVVVEMRSVACACVHDSKYHEMLATQQFPTATFRLTSPIPLASIPADGEVVELPVTGDFTIRGVTRSVRFRIEAVQRDGRIGVNAVIPVHLADYGIQNPDAGAFGGLSNAAIELLVGFVRA